MNGKKCVSLLLALCMALALTSCGAKPGQEPEKDSGPAETETGAETAPETGPETEPDAVAVSTAAELIAAIAPDAHIILAPGTYNFSALTEEEIALCSGYVNRDYLLNYDEFLISDVTGLTLEAAESGMAELVTENGSAMVLDLLNCDGVTLRGLSCGHVVEQGECGGAVLYAKSCKNLTVEDCFLYGCGTDGICTQQVEGLTVTGTEIYDCSESVFTLGYETAGAVFDRCRFFANRSDSLFCFANEVDVLVKDTEIFDNAGDLMPEDAAYGWEAYNGHITFRNCTFRDNPNLNTDPNAWPYATFENCDLPAPSLASDDQPYSELLRQYRLMMAYPYRFSDADWPGAQGTLRLLDDMSQWYGYDFLSDEMGYVIQDFSGDDVPELAVGPLPNYEVWLGALYTLVDGEPQLVFSYGEDGRYAYTGDGTFFYVGSSGDTARGQGTYHLTEDGTALICDSFCFYLVGEQTVYTNTTGSWDVSESWESGMDISDFNAWEGFEPAYETPLTPFSADD